MMGRVFEFASDGGRIVARKTKKSGLTAVAIILGRLAARAEARAGQAQKTAKKARKRIRKAARRVRRRLRR